ncbi:MAG: YdcF family protein, partial [bacterium]|nr:YdcF family protein [bacterium]
MDKKEIDRQAKVLWDYHRLNQPLEKADCILVLGSQDIRVAERGAQLFLDGWAPLVVTAGSFGRFTKKWKKPEAEVFAERMTKMGVPADKILIENKSTNTGENIRFSKRTLDEKGIMVTTIIVVHKPSMERRTMATFKIAWPQVKVFVTSPQISFEKYPNKTISKKR